MFYRQTDAVGEIVTAERVENYKTFNNLIEISTNYQRHAALLNHIGGWGIFCQRES